MVNLEHKLLQGSVDGILAFDRECRYIFWNPAMERISGVPKEAALGRNAFELFPLLREIGEDRRLLDALEGKSSVSRLKSFSVPETGHEGFFEGHYSPIYGDGGEVVGGMSVIRDLTDQMRTDQKLRETENRFRVMADCAPVLLWMSRKDALCDFFNQSWLQFTGRTQEEEWGIGWAEGVHAEDFQRCVDTYMAAFSKRRSFTMEYRLRRCDGQYRWILDRGVPRYSPDGDFMGYIGSCIDITDRKEAEEERARLIVQLGEALKIREEFIAVASHELKTPLTPLKLQVQLLNRHWINEPALQDKRSMIKGLVDIADRQLDRLSELVDELLDVTRINEGRLSVEKREVNLVELVRAAAEKFGPQLAALKIPMTITGDREVKGFWDPARLEQVVANLLSNALKYGKGKPVEISVSCDGRTARLSVRDRGIGISKADQERIFNRFERAVSYKSFGGLGLGLYISKQLILAHGGEIRVESERDQGSTFIVELPALERRYPDAIHAQEAM